MCVCVGEGRLGFRKKRRKELMEEEEEEEEEEREINANGTGF